MKEFLGSGLFTMATTLNHLADYYGPDLEPPYAPGQNLSDEDRASLGTTFAGFVEGCDFMELPAGKAACQRVVDAVSQNLCTVETVCRLIQRCEETIGDELRAHRYLHLCHSQAELYKEPLRGWPHTVAKRQKVAQIDIEEASKCLALERNTACVFHLMRLVEVALKAVHAELGLPATFDPNWAGILKKIKDKLDERTRSKNPAWMKEKDFYYETYATIDAVKHAWRNPTMHFDNHCDSERAEEIYRAVRAFLELIFSKLS
jgi:HEPN domain-containing protein